MMVPPVRNSKAIKESKAKKEPVKRISGFDFKAWDKLDVVSEFLSYLYCKIKVF